MIEKSNWTGQGLVFPRNQFAEARQRNELRRTGVYVLWGPGESGNLPRIYVGEGDPVLPRLDQHMRQKDFWTRAIVFTSKDENLNKAHVQYLEASLLNLAFEAKRAEIENTNMPQKPSLSEADEADALAFLEDLLLCLPLVGLSVFEKPKVRHQASPELYLVSKHIRARGVETTEGFVVRAGSQAIKKVAPSLSQSVRRLRKALVRQNVLVDKGSVTNCRKITRSARPQWLLQFF